MLVYVILSASYIAHESNHHCMDDNCPVCACIQQCEHTLRQLIDAVPVLIFFVLPVVCFLSTLFHLSVFTPETPVSTKVRLNN